MNNTSNLKKIGLSLTALTTGFLVKKMLESGYRKVYREEPPNSTEHKQVNFPKALAWTLISGVLVTGTRLLIKRGGAAKVSEKKG